MGTGATVTIATIPSERAAEPGVSLASEKPGRIDEEFAE